MRRQLPCKLTSYAADTGNKHRFALHILGYRIDIDTDDLTFQKILDIDVAYLLYADLAVCDLIKSRKLFDLAARVRAYLDASRRSPTIGTPNIRLSCFERSSSIMQTTRFDEWSLF